MAIAGAIVLGSVVLAPVSHATTIFNNSDISNFLLIGTGPFSEAIAVHNSSFEVGAIQAPVPAPSNEFLGPDLQDSQPILPGNAQAVPTGITYDGQAAITNSSGKFDYSGMGVYAEGNYRTFGEAGVYCADGASECSQGVSNSAYNLPGYPNDIEGNQWTVPIPNASKLGPGIGVVGDVDFTELNNELAAVKSEIASLGPATQIIDLGGGSLQPGENGVVSGACDDPNNCSIYTTTLESGLNVIDVTADGDINVNFVNWVIDGPSDAFAIFRIPDGKNFKVSQSNILAGSGLGSLNQLVFASLNTTNGEHFNVNNAIVNGVAFWSLFGHKEGLPEMSVGEINWNNVQGCTQAIAGKINLNDVRLNQCGPGVIPVPAALPLLITGLASFVGFGFASRRKRKAA